MILNEPKMSYNSIIQLIYLNQFKEKMERIVLGSGSMFRHVAGHLAMGDKIQDKLNVKTYQRIVPDLIIIPNQDHIGAAN